MLLQSLLRNSRKKHDKPVLKGAYVQESVYVGENLIETLISVKTKQELIGDVIMLLQSPAKNVVSAFAIRWNENSRCP